MIMFERQNWSVRNYIEAYLILFIYDKSQGNMSRLGGFTFRASNRNLPRKQSKNRNYVKNPSDTIN